MSHTPGPWKTVLPYYEDARKQGCLCVQIGKDDLYTTSEIKAADAHLISAAPDLLEACVLAYETMPDTNPTERLCIRKLKEVISKARGEK